MQLGCTARRVSFRILLERAAAESLCAAESFVRTGRRPGGGVSFLSLSLSLSLPPLSFCAHSTYRRRACREVSQGFNMRFSHTAPNNQARAWLRRGEPLRTPNTQVPPSREPSTPPRYTCSTDARLLSEDCESHTCTLAADVSSVEIAVADSFCNT